MDVIKVKREQEYYIVKCPRCNKSITGISIKQVRHNYKMHRMFCDERRKAFKNKTKAIRGH